MEAESFKSSSTGKTEFENRKELISPRGKQMELYLKVIEAVTLSDLKGHGEWNQVEMDVHRTLARFPPNISDTQRTLLQNELTPLIVRILWRSPRFRYYQGRLTFFSVLLGAAFSRA
ncbi:unnamed protein product, partial [Toxocara canis]|uniref:Uncharacterized protein n=1 Tax=Toxocara canis TaxID=6265 RepID=A0A183VDN5_TOXCA